MLLAVIGATFTGGVEEKAPPQLPALAPRNLRRCKIERWQKSLKRQCIRSGTPLSLDDAWRLVERYVEHYNNVRLNSAVGYITPKDILAGRQREIHADRDRKLEVARKPRQVSRQQVL